MRPSSVFAPCERCGVFPGARHGYKCLCHQGLGDPAYEQAVSKGFVRGVNMSEEKVGRVACDLARDGWRVTPADVWNVYRNGTLSTPKPLADVIVEALAD